MPAARVLTTSPEQVDEIRDALLDVDDDPPEWAAGWQAWAEGRRS